MSHYHPEYVSQFYDAYGDREWQRLTATPEDEVKLHVHTHYLRKHLQAGMRVLEIGAGAGRFTQVLAGLGCRLWVADISAGQLELNRQHASSEGFEAAIENWQVMDICDMSPLPGEAFDAVVAYGGPLSYVFVRADRAVLECKRVLRPGGVVLLSVMSLWGTVHQSLRGVLAVPAAQNERITASGDLIPEYLPGNTHNCHMYRSQELRDVLEQAGLQVVDLSASNCLSTHWNALLLERRQGQEDTSTWQELLRMEVEACAAPGCLDMGTHLLAVARK